METREKLKQELARAAARNGFAATAMMVMARDLGLLSETAKGHYDESLRLMSAAFDHEPNTEPRIRLAAESFDAAHKMADEIRARM